MGDSFNRCRRIDRHSCLRAGLPDRGKRPVKMPADFGMNSNDLSPGITECPDIRVWRTDHQMGIETLGRTRTQIGDHRRAEGDIGHKITVHDIEMHPIRTGSVNRLDFITKPTEISRQDRRCNTDRSHVLASDQLAHGDSSVDHAAGKAPFIIIPCHDPAQPACHHLGLIGVENRRMRIMDKIR